MKKPFPIRLREVARPVRKRFLYVHAGQRGRPTFSLYYDDRPSPAMLKNLPPVIASYELAADAPSSLEALAADYSRRLAAGEGKSTGAKRP